MGRRLGPPHWAALLGAVLVEIAAAAMSWGREPAWDTLVYALYALANVTAGVLILARHPRHVIGRLLVLTGMLQAVVTDLGQGWALLGASRGRSGAVYGDLVANASWPLGGALMAATFVLFPTGRRPGTGRVWHWVLPLAFFGAILTTAGWACGDQVGALLVGGRNPLQPNAIPAAVLFWVGFVALALSMLLGALAMVLRMRDAAGVERQQLKWMVFAVVVVLATLIPSALYFADSAIVRIIDAVVLTALPLAALAAIWRYRLYDIELIISRTVLYGMVTMMLAGGFIGLTLGLGIVFGGGGALATAGATLAASLAFRPLRGWLQEYVDRWFDRGRYDAHREVARFMADLREGRREPEEVGQVIADASSRIRSEEARSRLVPSLEREASLAIEMAQLRSELRQQLSEVRDSRSRILEATESERRRIERDLHDGTQQRLVAVGLALRHVQHQLGTGQSGVNRTLDAVVQEVADAIEELRDIARGIRPGVLDDGLASALRDLAQRTQLPIEIDVPANRLPRDLETAVYFIACEGVTNAAKHAGAHRIDVRVRQDADWLVVRVSDDGVGGATPRDGGGLVGVRDRAAAHGGRLRILSEPGMGTTLVAELACGS